MKKYTIQLAGLGVIALLLAVSVTSCTDGTSSPAPIVKRSDPVPVKVMEVKGQEKAVAIQSSGKITTDNETFLSFKVAGVIESVLVEEGDAIRKGQLLATIDQREINAIVAQAKLGYEKSLRDFTRVERLYKDSVATLEQVQNAKTALDLATQQLDAATFNRQFSKIVAQHDGFVLKKFVNAGQVIGIGDPVFITNGTSPNKWILRINVTDKQWAMIRLQDKAEVKLDAFPGMIYEAKVLRKSETSDPATGTFNVDLQVKNGASTFASGMFASASIITKNIANVWSLPYEAVLDANGNEGFVFVTPDYKKAVRQSVTISGIDQDRVLITDGLENIPAVIVSGSAYLTDMSEITIIK